MELNRKGAFICQAYQKMEESLVIQQQSQRVESDPLETLLEDLQTLKKRMEEASPSEIGDILSELNTRGLGIGVRIELDRYVDPQVLVESLADMLRIAPGDAVILKAPDPLLREIG